ncbi:UPF0280 family protein [Rhizobacter sp. Root404]|uniref:UPF0280 family protein n=1 Tax=Rhizobacter sp. Root404 TaxID=1736528 RepID=UPI0006FF2260|nr:UPF0280 family protein [Rhizobacter sp. Root404]KQW34297.1 thiamine biosynthesis protein ApbE [Rhizobacter sp. Root404]
MHATRARLADGRWHFQHGPIDLVIGAEGEPGVVEAAHAAAWARFQTVLPELVAELRTLRLPVRGPCPLQGVVARRMWLACRPFHSQFITPMAAVAGAVAQEIVPAYERPGIDRTWVNNGGDIALHLAPGASVKVGLFADLARFDPADGTPRLDGNFTVTADLPVRGIATSGWRGRSFSLGIADSVTVLARTAAMADAAATVIANAVTVDDTRIARRPACELKDDSDLGDLLVTVAVPPLPPVQVQAALQAGAARARALQRDGLIHSALLVCQHRALGVEAPVPGELPSAAAAVGSVFA